jgi:hypothetical protein
MQSLSKHDFTNYSLFIQHSTWFNNYVYNIYFGKIIAALRQAQCDYYFLRFLID